MSRTAFPRTLMATAVLFGLVSAGFASIALMKAPPQLPVAPGGAGQVVRGQSIRNRSF
jgi:hypothetical protein